LANSNRRAVANRLHYIVPGVDVHPEEAAHNPLLAHLQEMESPAIPKQQGKSIFQVFYNKIFSISTYFFNYFTVILTVLLSGIFQISIFQDFISERAMRNVSNLIFRFYSNFYYESRVTNFRNFI
jgi:hypothetical protein